MTEVFVFGSNKQGRHGSGAALHARKKYGAVYGTGIGHTGDAYGIPTKSDPYTTLTLMEIDEYVGVFLMYAVAHPELTFRVTRVGCGLAGYTDSDIAPMFRNAPDNCILPKGWSESHDMRGLSWAWGETGP